MRPGGNRGQAILSLKDRSKQLALYFQRDGRPLVTMKLRSLTVWLVFIREPIERIMGILFVST
jgi:hypothetical protein